VVNKTRRKTKIGLAVLITTVILVAGGFCIGSYYVEKPNIVEIHGGFFNISLDQSSETLFNFAQDLYVRLTSADGTIDWWRFVTARLNDSALANLVREELYTSHGTPRIFKGYNELQAGWHVLFKSRGGAWVMNYWCMADAYFNVTASVSTIAREFAAPS